MNFFTAEYRDGITYGHCKGLDDLTTDQALVVMREKYPTALRIIISNAEHIMRLHVEAFWERRAIKGGLSK